MRHFNKILGMTAVVGVTFTLAMPALGYQGCMAVTVPSNQASYSVGLTGLYARATDRSLVFSTCSTFAYDDSGVQIISVARNFLSPRFDYGYRLDAGYLLAETGNDISVNWTYHNSDDQQSLGKIDQNTAQYGALGDMGISSLVKGETCYRFQELNIDVGQKIDFCRLHSRLTVGFQYASVSEHLLSRAYSDQYGNISNKLASDFWGVGPHVGIDLTLPLFSRCSRFALVGHFTSALLYSDICASNTIVYSYTRDINLHVQQRDIRTITPTTTMKLAVAYSSSHDPAVGGLGVELGWQSSCYYKVVHRVYLPDYITLFTPTFSSFNKQQLSNAGFDGAYLSLRYAV